MKGCGGGLRAPRGMRKRVCTAVGQLSDGRTGDNRGLEACEEQAGGVVRGGYHCQSEGRAGDGSHCPIRVTVKLAFCTRMRVLFVPTSLHGP